MSANFPGYGGYTTLFRTLLKSETLEQLTFFPEQVMYLKNLNEIQIQNRFGVFRFNVVTGAVSAIELFTSFVKNNILKEGKLPPLCSSPDGKYLLYISGIKNAYGNLVLFKTAEKKEYIVSRDVELNLNNPPGTWSGDSRTFIYSKKGNLYYFSIDHMEQDRVFTENLRLIEKGVLKNVCWVGKDSLYYVTGSFIYRISSSEFFARAFYKGILRLGAVAGKIPFEFDPNFDSFWISPDGKKILLSKAGRNLFIYFLNSDDYTSVGEVQSLPYLFLSSNSMLKRIIWSNDDQITVLVHKSVYGRKAASLFRIAVKSNTAFSSFIKTDDAEVLDIILSPDEKTILLVKPDGVELRNYISWQQISTVNHPGVLNAVWKNEYELILAGTYSTIIYNTLLKSSSLVALSQAGDYGFSKDEQSILIKLSGSVYSVAIDKTAWKSTPDFRIKNAALESGSYRIYLTDQQGKMFRNMIMIRSIAAEAFGTVPLLEENKSIVYEPFPDKDEPIDLNYFNHGSRLRRREVAFVFNVIDSIQGLPAILEVLSEYNIKATFFVNGEAISRYPGGVKEIAYSGHEAGSLFYANFNMTDSRYSLDKEYIKKGLGINEDEYYAVTGKDLALYWHAPYYFVNSLIIDASKEMNYVYVGKDVETQDWVTEEEMNITRGIYLSSAELIEKIMKDKKPGSIIPITIGLSRGRRDDYLFNSLDILINALLSSGYSIVPVSTLVNHAR
jgi:peptidoglycan/xylan/chitin deacetylase (PgdA/CDA1 family)